MRPSRGEWAAGIVAACALIVMLLSLYAILEAVT